MFFDDIKIGMKQDLKPVVVKKDEMIAFAKSYDNCPIHVDEDIADPLIKRFEYLINKIKTID